MTMNHTTLSGNRWKLLFQKHSLRSLFTAIKQVLAAIFPIIIKNISYNIQRNSEISPSKNLWFIYKF